MTNRSDKYTINDSFIQEYSDFVTDFSVNPLTGFLAKVTNEDSIKQSLKNLILTERTERFYRPYIGSKIWSLLFEPMDVSTEELLRTTIKETINNNEPRVELADIDIQANQEWNAYFITIKFKIRSIPGSLESLDLILKRVR